MKNLLLLLKVCTVFLVIVPLISVPLLFLINESGFAQLRASQFLRATFIKFKGSCFLSSRTMTRKVGSFEGLCSALMGSEGRLGLGMVLLEMVEVFRSVIFFFFCWRSCCRCHQVGSQCQVHPCNRRKRPLWPVL